MSGLTERVADRETTLASFLQAEKRQLALAAYSLARAFGRGATLMAYGVGAAETDAAHIAVEFMHPVIVGKRALPALAPPNDVLALLRAGDVAVGIAHADNAEIAGFLNDTRRRGAETLAFTGRNSIDADFSFAVTHDDPHVVQEVHETAYHVLWELVHVFFEHPGLLADACITCGDTAVEARVVAIDGDAATIEKDGLREAVATDLVDDVSIGDVLLCHAGVALERVG